MVIFILALILRANSGVIANFHTLQDCRKSAIRVSFECALNAPRMTVNCYSNDQELKPNALEYLECTSNVLECNTNVSSVPRMWYSSCIRPHSRHIQDICAVLEVVFEVASHFDSHSNWLKCSKNGSNAP